MEQRMKAMAASANRADGSCFLEADKEFHMVPVRRLGNQHVVSIMENIRSYISLFGLRGQPLQGRYEEITRAHSAIQEALGNKDRKKAVLAVRHHLDTTERHLVKHILL